MILITTGLCRGTLTQADVPGRVATSVRAQGY
jgi:hypothetical protein